MQNLKRVLILDDDRDAACAVSKFLESEGYETKIIRDSRAALDALEKDAYGIILLDIKMSHPEEASVLDKIKQLAPEAIVIVFTDDEDSDKQKEIAQKGVFGVIYKPHYLDYVKKILNKLNRGKNASGI